MKRFCRECGTKLQTVECNYYDEETGKKVKKDICPKVGCTKNCDFYGCEVTDYLWKKNRCTKCKEIPYSCLY